MAAVPTHLLTMMIVVARPAPIVLVAHTVNALLPLVVTTTIVIGIVGPLLPLAIHLRDAHTMTHTTLVHFHDAHTMIRTQMDIADHILAQERHQGGIMSMTIGPTGKPPFLSALQLKPCG
jgi:hypothetical protein